jgi:hypothetical protein
MRHAAVGMLLGFALLWALVATAVPSRDAFGQFDRGTRSGQPGDLVTLALPGEVGNFVAVVDPQQVLCVYEVGRMNGNITLKSVRQLSWDLQLDEFNTTNPSPRDIRAMVERR